MKHIDLRIKRKSMKNLFIFKISLVISFVFVLFLLASCSKQDAIMVLTYEVVYPDTVISHTVHIKCYPETVPHVSSSQGTNWISADGLLEETTAPIRIINYKVYKEQK